MRLLAVHPAHGALAGLAGAAVLGLAPGEPSILVVVVVLDPCLAQRLDGGQPTDDRGRIGAGGRLQQPDAVGADLMQVRGRRCAATPRRLTSPGAPSRSTMIACSRSARASAASRLRNSHSTE